LESLPLHCQRTARAVVYALRVGAVLLRDRARRGLRQERVALPATPSTLEACAKAMTPLMRDILLYLKYNGTSTPNQIGYGVGVAPVEGGRGQGGRGKGHRNFGAAQRIIFPLTRLRKLGFVVMTNRLDGKSGTAYLITDTGREALYQDTRRRRT